MRSGQGVPRQSHALPCRFAAWGSIMQETLSRKSQLRRGQREGSGRRARWRHDAQGLAGGLVCANSLLQGGVADSDTTPEQNSHHNGGRRCLHADTGNGQRRTGTHTLPTLPAAQPGPRTPPACVTGSESDVPACSHAGECFRQLGGNAQQLATLCRAEEALEWVRPGVGIYGTRFTINGQLEISRGFLGQSNLAMGLTPLSSWKQGVAVNACWSKGSHR